MLSNSSIISGFRVVYDNDRDDDVVIDSNQKIQELLERQAREYKEKLRIAERERRIAELEASGESIPEGMDPDEFLGLADAIMQEEEPQIDYVEEAKAQAEEILAEAKAQAQGILDAANTNAKSIEKMARQEAEQAGYSTGIERAEIELNQAKAELEAKAQMLEQDYYSKCDMLEHQVVEQCMGVFEKVFRAKLSGDKDVIYHLLNQCIMNIERTKQFQIKVSDSNVDYIKEKKDEILMKVGSDVTIDIIADPMLDDSQAIIETDGGVFDCSLDTELDALAREIIALS